MLNSDTKRHIDAARDVLVGVAPNPTTQIDQITYALIYKFMDDMDQAAIKAGGEPSFFTGDLEPFAWSKLMDARVGNQEKMNQYGEALVKFSEAKQLPELFRTIFRSAFLPYRSPETLGLFLKEISYFDYTHPEELGNAYEYLLSIMSSQGDAGQFRTPRHIIDFVVDVLNPTKDDKVLDPACGTGGFLVSTYNHILEQHDGKNDPKKKEKPLTPDERKKLMANLEGYDIDPTMVRIAQVNMYLHQFKNPQIFQYDSLTSDDRWNDKFDVILANPPFMSPKGGIKPHSKFGIKSNRSEALFVDYIVSHLKPKGRAGIIVPEGVIFKNDSAFKDLRKNLIQNGLYAVVSLPGGVFQPYSGVKTSILFLDRDVANAQSKIMFINIGADGFDLGATKRIVEKNDLPEALQLLEFWSKGEEIESKISSYVPKDVISGKDDFNLSGEKYKIGKNSNSSEWEMVQLEDILDYEQPTKYIVESVDYDDSYPTPVLTAGKTFVLGKTNEIEGIFKDNLPVVIFDDFTTASKYVDFPFKVKSSAMKILHAKSDKVLIRYAYYAIQNLDFPVNEHKRYWISEYSKLQIPLPPLEVQKQIIAELDGYAAIISGAKQIVDNWKPTIDGSSDFEMVELNRFCKIQNGFAFASTDMGDFQEGYLPVIKIGNVGADGVIDTKCKFHAYSKKLDNFILTDGDVVIAMTGATVGKVATIPKGRFLLNQRVGKVDMTSEEVTLDYVRLALQSSKFYAYCQATATGGAQGNISSEEILRFQIPLAPSNVQLELTRLVQEERKQIDSLRTLISIYEARTQASIAKLWNE
jgi:type I restriction enzyme M protein